MDDDVAANKTPLRNRTMARGRPVATTRSVLSQVREARGRAAARLPSPDDAPVQDDIGQSEEGGSEEGSEYEQSPGRGDVDEEEEDEDDNDDVSLPSVRHAAGAAASKRKPKAPQNTSPKKASALKKKSQAGKPKKRVTYRNDANRKAIGNNAQYTYGRDREIKSKLSARQPARSTPIGEEEEEQDDPSPRRKARSKRTAATTNRPLSKTRLSDLPANARKATDHARVEVRAWVAAEDPYPDSDALGMAAATAFMRSAETLNNKALIDELLDPNQEHQFAGPILGYLKQTDWILRGAMKAIAVQSIVDSYKLPIAYPDELKLYVAKLREDGNFYFPNFDPDGPVSAWGMVYDRALFVQILSQSFFTGDRAPAIRFPEMFKPLRKTTLALVLTVVESALDDWRTGVFVGGKKNSMTEERFEGIYHAHLAQLDWLERRSKSLFDEIREVLYEKSSAGRLPTTKAARAKPVIYLQTTLDIQAQEELYRERRAKAAAKAKAAAVSSDTSVEYIGAGKDDGSSDMSAGEEDATRNKGKGIALRDEEENEVERALALSMHHMSLDAAADLSTAPSLPTAHVESFQAEHDQADLRPIIGSSRTASIEAGPISTIPYAPLVRSAGTGQGCTTSTSAVETSLTPPDVPPPVKATTARKNVARKLKAKAAETPSQPPTKKARGSKSTSQPVEDVEVPKTPARMPDAISSRGRLRFKLPKSS